MRKLFIFIICMSLYKVDAQNMHEVTVKTEVSDVTVFISGAQIIRKKNVDIKSGVTVLKFSGLSPFIEGKSVQVKASGNVTVLSVNHQQNFIDELEKSDELLALEQALKETLGKLDVEKAHLDVIRENLLLLQENRTIGGKSETLNVIDLKAASNFYSDKLTALKLNEIDRNNKLKEPREEVEELSNQINGLATKKDFANGEIVLKVEAKNYTNTNIELSYLVGTMLSFQGLF